MNMEEIFEEEENMNSDETKKSVDQMKQEVNKLNSAIEEIQSNCRHADYSIKNTSKDSAIIRRVCDTCNAVIGYPSDQELKDSGYM
jgi:hypothetical protein